VVEFDLSGSHDDSELFLPQHQIADVDVVAHDPSYPAEIVVNA